MKTPLLLKNVLIKVHLNLRNMGNMSAKAIHCFLCRKVWDIYFNLFVVGMLNKQEMAEASNTTRLRLTYRVKTFSHWLQVNNVRYRQIVLVSGLLFSC